MVKHSLIIAQGLNQYFNGHRQILPELPPLYQLYPIPIYFSKSIFPYYLTPLEHVNKVNTFQVDLTDHCLFFESIN
jgi:hypothetical protein